MHCLKSMGMKHSNAMKTNTLTIQTTTYIAGHRGLVGSSLVRELVKGSQTNLILRDHSELDLTNQGDTRRFFQKESPDTVVLAAARVGGIQANDQSPAEFIYENLAIQTNVISEAFACNVNKLLFLGSSCIYPRNASQPITESSLLTGPLESTNRPYAIAKIAGVEMCWSFNRQYGTHYCSVMPTNLYGPNDNYDLESSHVLPALIRKFHEAKYRDDKTVTLWGSGAPLREFLHSDDLAGACVLLLSLSNKDYTNVFSEDQPPLLNIGSGDERSISSLANLVAKVVGFRGKIEWDQSQPDGTPRKLLDSSRIRALGWKPKISLEQGVEMAYLDYLSARN